MILSLVVFEEQRGQALPLRQHLRLVQPTAQQVCVPGDDAHPHEDGLLDRIHPRQLIGPLLDVLIDPVPHRIAPR